jgi:hypothetical protein
LGAGTIRAVHPQRTTEIVMKYLIMAYESADAFETRTGEHQGAYLGAWRAYADALRHAGVMAGGKGLEPPSTGTTLRLRDGERTVQDGPYADTKEQLGGFFIIDVPDLDAALDWAARCPAAADGAVEVRPVLQSCQETSEASDEARAVVSA